MEINRNSYLTFDIETYKDLSDKKFLDYKMEKISAPANYKDQDKIDKYIEEKRIESVKKLALSPYTSKIITIGFKALNDETEILFLVPNIKPSEIAEFQSLHPTWFFFETEKELLKSAFHTINSALDGGSTLVSFNGKAFDMPFLFTRAIINNLTEPIRDYPELIHNYRHDKHLDLCSFFDKGSLNSLAYLTGIGDLYDEKGDAIDKHYEKNDYTAIYDKIIKDLNKTQLLYEKIRSWIPQRQSYY